MAETVVGPSWLVRRSPEWLAHFVSGAARAAIDTAVDARPLATCVSELKRHQAWDLYFTDGEKTWERFCREALQSDAAFVDLVTAGVEALEARGRRDAISRDEALRAAIAGAETPEGKPVLAKHGAVGNGRESRPDNIRSTSDYGTSQSYLARRLKRDHPAIFDQLKAGAYRSVRAAAKDAGLVRDKAALDHLTHWWAKATPDERSSFLSFISRGEVA